MPSRWRVRVGRAVGDSARRGVRRERRVDQRDGQAGHRPQLDGHHVVARPGARSGSRPASPATSPSGFGLAVGGMATLSRSMSALVEPVKFWNPGTTPAGMPVSRIASQVGPRLRVRRQVREHPRVQHRQQLRPAPAWSTYFVEPRVLPRRPGVPLVLLGHRDQHLVDQRVAEPGDLLPGPVADVLALPAVPDLRLLRLAVDQTPMTDFADIGSVGLEPSRVSSRIGTWIAIVCTLKPCTPLTPAVLGHRDQVQVVERTQRRRGRRCCPGRRRTRRPAGRRTPCRRRAGRVHGLRRPSAA